MSWLEKAKGVIDKGVQEAKEEFNKGMDVAKVNLEEANEERRIQKEEQKKLLDSFKTTSKSRYVEIDKENTLWRLTSNKREIFKFENLSSYELIQDGDTLTSGGLGLGRAVVGTVIAGPIGAVLGGLTKRKKSSTYTNSLRIRISNSEAKKTTTFIDLINKKTNHNSKEYKKAIELAQETLGVLDIISDVNEKNKSIILPLEKATDDSMDKIRQLKGLLDDGILTQDEFDAKKKELLGL